MIRTTSLSATSLRLILVISLFIIGIFASIAFLFTTDRLKDAATEVSSTLARANDSQNDIQNLQRVQDELARNKDVVERASSIVAESQSYQYQDQIIKDLTDYANRAGIAITNFDFAAAKATTTTPNATTPAPTQPNTPSGVNSTSASITIKNPVNYESLLRFLNSIEQNLTKMQISKVGLSKEASGGIASDALTIEVYIR